MHLSPSRLTRLRDGLLDLFGENKEFDRFLRSDDRWGGLDVELPDPDRTSRVDYMDDAVQRLHRRGWIDAAFFEALEAERPGRRDEISRLQREVSPHFHLEEDEADSDLTDEERWEDYLSQLPTLVPFATELRARELWDRIKLRFSELPLPIAGPHGEAEFQFAWNQAHAYLDLELFADGSVAWTWLDRVHGAAEGEEGKRFGSLSPRFFEHLEQMGAKP